MSLLTVEGTYKNDKVSLAETPPAVEEARVLNTFLPNNQHAQAPRYMTFGQLRGDGSRMSSEEDFKIAEWRGDEEDVVAATDADPRVQLVPFARPIFDETLRLIAVTEMHDRQIVATALSLISQGAAVQLITRDANITGSGLVPVIW